jgi:hypothetical protein
MGDPNSSSNFLQRLFDHKDPLENVTVAGAELTKSIPDLLPLFFKQ